MKAKGKTYLRIAGIIEIVLGIGAIILIQFILTDGKSDFMPNIEIGKEALGTLVLVYVLAGYRVIAGLVALILANKPKKANVCLFFAIVLIIIANLSIKTAHLDLKTFITNCFILIGPVFYLCGAIQNYRSNEVKKQKDLIN